MSTRACQDSIRTAGVPHGPGAPDASLRGLPAIAPVSPALKDVDMYLYLHKKHQALAPRLAQALKDMKADGTYNRIMSGITAE